jgi:phenylalanyl-tRNA synthetase alpha chain
MESTEAPQAGRRYVPENDHAVLTALARRAEAVDLQVLAGELGVDQARVAAVCQARRESGEILVEERTIGVEARLTAKGKSFSVLPERSIIGYLAEVAQADLDGIARERGLDKKVVGECIRPLLERGWVKKDGKTLEVTDAGRAAAQDRTDGEVALFEALKAKGGWGVVEGDETRRAAEALSKRKVVETRERTARLVSLTDAGRALVDGGIAPRRQVNQLTSEMLLSGEWRQVELRPYDVTLAAEPVYPGKDHPLVRTFQRTRRVFLEMGFEEIVSPYVESSFWDFDALFQPQDHPARELQDTFYIARPGPCALPDEDLVERVRRTHEDGGDTGSVGWRYPWDREVARRPVLRTHTTASTIRALARDPRPPRKVFCIGPVFRRETVDYKHLPVFYQVDGVIIDEHASLATLLGTLAAFYTKMGFERFQFRPGFFPYTEPSVEVFVWSDKKHDWVEMGGSGVFRPEVTRPFGCKAPVLAWGLGLERIALFHYELSSISELYRSRLGWLKETPICR